MLKCDMHTHTEFSDDCKVPIDEACLSAIAMGMDTLAVTDHYDPGFSCPPGAFQLKFPEYEAALCRAKEQYAGRLDVIMGIEGGIMEDEYDALNDAVSGFPYDFVIGSFHSYKKKDLTGYDFKNENCPEILGGYYEDIYNSLKMYNNYDIVGHITCIDRYTEKLYDYKPYDDIIDEILKHIVYNGKGLEINTSSFAYRMGTWLPRESVLKRYRNLGGEILTFGSDSHITANYMAHFGEAAELAQAMGFRYHCIFKGRRPEFIAL